MKNKFNDIYMKNIAIITFIFALIFIDSSYANDNNDSNILDITNKYRKSLILIQGDAFKDNKCIKNISDYLYNKHFTLNGFFISKEGHLITSAILSFSRNQIFDIQIWDGSIHKAKLIGTDHTTGISLLKVLNKIKNFAYINVNKFNENNKIHLNSDVYMYGIPISNELQNSQGKVINKYSFINENNVSLINSHNYSLFAYSYTKGYVGYITDLDSSLINTGYIAVNKNGRFMGMVLSIEDNFSRKAVILPYRYINESIFTIMNNIKNSYKLLGVIFTRLHYKDALDIGIKNIKFGRDYAIVQNTKYNPKDESVLIPGDVIIKINNNEVHIDNIIENIYKMSVIEDNSILVYRNGKYIELQMRPKYQNNAIEDHCYYDSNNKGKLLNKKDNESDDDDNSDSDEKNQDNEDNKRQIQEDKYDSQIFNGMDLIESDNLYEIIKDNYLKDYKGVIINAILNRDIKVSIPLKSLIISINNINIYSIDDLKDIINNLKEQGQDSFNALIYFYGEQYWINIPILD